MEAWIMSYLGEILLAGVMGIVAWAFKAWSATLKDTSEKILSRLDYLTKEFHQHKVDVERRVTRVETKVDLIHHDNIEHRSRSDGD